MHTSSMTHSTATALGSGPSTATAERLELANMDNSLLPSVWLNEQRRQQRQLVLIANPMAEPNPVPPLFAQAPIGDYVKLYQGTEFDSLAALGPWLLHIGSSATPALSALLQTPQQNWGWVASVAHLHMHEIAAHWRARMVVHDNNQRAFYRLHDNRVMARHLQALDHQQRPLLLGPFSSALCWAGQHWVVVENPSPGLYPEPFDTPWLAAPPSSSSSAATTLEHLAAWLMEHHAAATQQLLTRTPLVPWLQTQLDAANRWGWHSQEHVYFLLKHQLIAELVDHPAWLPRPNEAPAAQQTLRWLSKGSRHE